MRRRVLSICLSLVIALLALAGSMRGVPLTAAAPQAKTNECGLMKTDTTWDLAGSPYQLNCNVGVIAGVQLTIQPGVVVYGTSGATLQIQGTLIANGSSSSRITFETAPSVDTMTPTSYVTCNGQSFTASDWCGIQFIGGASTSSSISYDDISGTARAIDGYPGSQLIDNSYSNGDIGIYFGSNLPNGGLVISNSNFYALRQAAIWCYCSSGLSVTSSNVANGGIGVYVDGITSVTGSSIYGNQVGVDLDESTSGAHVNNDNIDGNATYNLRVSGALNATVDATVDATNNWWGSTVATAIQQSIDDCYMDLTRPCVTFTPYQSTPITCAPCVTPLPTNTATPAITPTATNTVTSMPTSTPVPTNTLQPTNTATPAATATASATPTDTATATDTDTPTDTATAADTDTPIPTDTPITPEATATTQITTSIALDPSSQTAADGATVSVYGGGFGSSEPVTASYTATLSDGSTQTESATNVTSDNGTVTITGLPVPANVTSGDYQVTAIGASSGDSASATLTVLGNDTPTPTDTEVPSPTDIPTDTGAPTATDIPGATDMPTDTPTVDTGVAPPTTGTSMPAIVIAPDTVNAGGLASLTIYGGEFLPNEPVSVSYDASLLDGSTQHEELAGLTQANGTFVLKNLPVPANIAPGSYTITAHGASSGITATVTLTAMSSTSTSTTAATPTPTPTVTSTSSPAGVYSVHLKYVKLRYPFVREGTFDHVSARVNHGGIWNVTATIYFPNGHTAVYRGKSDKTSFWQQTFSVPKNDYLPNNRVATVSVQYKRSSWVAKDTANFTIVAVHSTGRRH